MAMLEVRNLAAGYGHKSILQDISFHVASGELVGLLGANGSGKTTLLKALCGIIPCRGEVTLMGKPIQGLSHREMAKISRYIPQRSGISIDISALDVVLMGFYHELPLLGDYTADMTEKAKSLLAEVGLSGKETVNFQTLSEGQKQLCILARTMASEHGMLFLDEPESALDFGGRYRMLFMVKQRVTAGECGGLVTLHDPQLALNTCDRLLLLDNGHLESEICPRLETEAQIEEKLSRIYGSLSVRRMENRSGKQNLLLLKEDESWM